MPPKPETAPLLRFSVRPALLTLPAVTPPVSDQQSGGLDVSSRMSASFLETGSCVRPSGVGLSSPEAAERSPRALVTGDIFHSSGAIIRVKRGFMIHPRKLRHPGSPEPRAGPRPARAEASRLRVRLSVLWPSSLMPASLTLLGAREGPVTGRQVGALQPPPTPPRKLGDTQPPSRGLRRGPALPTAWVWASGLQDPETQFVALGQSSPDTAHSPVPRGDGLKARGHAAGGSTPLPLFLVFLPAGPQLGPYGAGGASGRVPRGPFRIHTGPRPPRLPVRSPLGSRPLRPRGGVQRGGSIQSSTLTVALYNTGGRVTSDASSFVG